ncbi:MAG: hypothetical protein V3575_06410 [Candidatus Absconditabacteria bacterium]
MIKDTNSKRFTNAIKELGLDGSTIEEKSQLLSKLEQINKGIDEMLTDAFILAQELNNKSLTKEEINIINEKIAVLMTTPIPGDDTGIHEKNKRIIYGL